MLQIPIAYKAFAAFTTMKLQVKAEKNRWNAIVLNVSFSHCGHITREVSHWISRIVVYGLAITGSTPHTGRVQITIIIGKTIWWTGLVLDIQGLRTHLSHVLAVSVIICPVSIIIRLSVRNMVSLYIFRKQFSSNRAQPRTAKHFFNAFWSRLRTFLNHV